MQNALNPKLFEGDSLKPQVREKLLEIAYKFTEFLKVKQAPIDIILTGSNANFNYSNTSDIDLHTVFDFSKFPASYEFVDNYMKAKKALWNEEHKIKIFGHEVELYGQSATEPHYASGMYSVLKNKWLKYPKKEAKQVDDKKVKDKAETLMYAIDKAIASDDIKKMEVLKDKIVQMRQSGLEKGGEYATENLVFKFLRNNGYLEKFSKARTELLDKMLSLSRSFGTEFN